ncbi:MAG: thiamine-phosphate kinase [Candidatus Krumholzibacteriota bacterium]|nr:thiamine-phosphate kinase [Candidatus Krumholzibacteriota bacterium]
MKESTVIETLKRGFPEAQIGDDAALLASGRGEIVLAADAVVEGVHYDLSFSTLSQAVQKVISSNVSDIFAMGAKARAILVTAGLTKGCKQEELDEIVKGLKLGCDYYGIELAGGDTVYSPGGGFFNIAITGEVPAGKAVRRKGAAPGDLIVMTGECGGSLSGMRLVKDLFEIHKGDDLAGAILPSDRKIRKILRDFVSEMDLSAGPEEIKRFCGNRGIPSVVSGGLGLIRQYLVPPARPLDIPGIEAKGIEITSMIDVSDGVGKDLAALCSESGVGALIDEEYMPVPRVLLNLPEISRNLIISLALSSGEEYCQIATLRGAGGSFKAEGIFPVGKITDGDRKVFLRDRKGREREIGQSGYEHIF